MFQLKFTVKTLEKQSKKAEKNANTQKLKCKKAMEKGNIEVAKIHAESAIREKNQALNLLRLSARIDAVSQRVNTAVNMNGISNAMSGVVRSMSTVMQTMDAVKISAVMDTVSTRFNFCLCLNICDQSIIIVCNNLFFFLCCSLKNNLKILISALNLWKTLCKIKVQ